ncbi:MAG: hypothetical protein QOG68_1157 [Solirubrobacteraceae bacterium]|nr:hypothetical protein [Solirubrobacteraceae bacterium]
MPDHISVVICDDSLGFPTLAETWLVGDGRFAVVGHAKGGEEAKAIVAACRPDLLLLDLLLPDVPDTPALVTELRALAPGLRIMLISSMPADRLLLAGAKAGVEAVCSKAANAEQLADALYTVATG